MRMLKKVMAITVALAMVLSLMSFSVFAADDTINISITTDKTKVAQNGEIIVNVYYSKPGATDLQLTGHGFDIRYDTDVFDREGISNVTDASNGYKPDEVTISKRDDIVKFSSTIPMTVSDNTLVTLR